MQGNASFLQGIENARNGKWHEIGCYGHGTLSKDATITTTVTLLELQILNST